MSLNENEIRAAIEPADYLTKLMITPICRDDQVRDQVHVRLGSTFLLFKKPEDHQVDEAGQPSHNAFHRLFLHYNEEFVLHPHEHVLGLLFEFISSPRWDMELRLIDDFGGALQLQGYSPITPGFHGCPTLHLRNTSQDRQILLKPGMEFALLIVGEEGEEAVTQSCLTDIDPTTVL